MAGAAAPSSNVSAAVTASPNPPTLPMIISLSAARQDGAPGLPSVTD
jgi:hypothetical protein